MAYVAPYVDDSGLHIPAYIDIRDDLVEQFKTIYGQDIYLENDSQDYQMISAFAAKTYDSMQLLQIVYNNQSPKTAVGTGLSSLVKFNGLNRKSASYSTCVLTLTGTAGTVIAAGIVEDSAGYKWDLPQNLTFSGTTLSTTAQCETIGAIEAAIGTITKIYTPQAGWTAVTNLVAAVVGNPVETDEELKLRQSVSVSLPSQNITDGVISGVLSVSNVSKCVLYENDTGQTDSNGIPSHSISVVVEGGLDADIAKEIYERKGPGCGTFGGTQATYISSDGQQQIIKFWRPTYASIDVNIQIKKNVATFNLAKINSSITNYFLALSIGTNVTITGILAACMQLIEDLSKPDFSVELLQIRKINGTFSTDNIPIAYNEIAVLHNISLSEV